MGEQGGRAASVAAPENGGATAPAGRGAETPAPPGMSAGFARRIRRARLYCLYSMAAFPFLVPFWAGTGLLVDLPYAGGVLDGQPDYVLGLAVVRTVALFVASVLCALAMFRMIRERLDGRVRPNRILYRSTVALLLVVFLFLWHTPSVLGIAASAWVLLAFLSSRRELLYLTGGGIAVTVVNALVTPMRTALLPGPGGLGGPLGILGSLAGHGLIMLFWAGFLWIGCLYTIWLWDGIRRVTEGQQARAQLAVDGERLRFTNQIRELLWHRLDALRIGAGQAGRHVRTDPEAAEREIGQVHELARTTLRQVRSVVRGYRDIDLDAEVNSVRAVLEANGTVTAVTGLTGLNPPADTAALAAWVVREGGTNVLRHSRAQNCRIAFTEEPGSAPGLGELVVELRNDRAREGAPSGVGSDSGLAGLAERIAGGGGTLEATRTDDGGFLLRATLPLADGPAPALAGAGENGASENGAYPAPSGPVPATALVAPEPSEETTPQEADTELLNDLANDRRVRLSRRIIMALIGFNSLLLVVLALMDLVGSAEYRLPLWSSVVGTLLTVVVAGLLIRLLRERLDGNRRPSPGLFWLSVVLLLMGAVFLNNPAVALIMMGAWWGTGILFTTRWPGVVVTVLLLFAPLPLIPTFSAVLEPNGFNPLVYGLVWLLAVIVALTFLFSTFGTIWLWDISREAVAGQRARAQLAVTQERLRFARDMHDLLGHSLSALAVKAQLAGRLVDRAPDRALTEIAEVQGLAGQALQQMRSAVSGDREADLEGEVAAVGAVLDSGGTRTVVTGLEGLELPSEVAGLAAWVVREGATNVLRHSDARECQISFRLTRDGANVSRGLVVEVHNDSARARTPGGSDGNGLAGLSERVALAGGTLSRARTRDGGFLLRAVIPF
ncbi:sensor histidine kinase [Nocardiopsis prasina]|uniref:sensor histidine kinase n=1 Tax=Nocardiopsis prasina TaxID=2015 RepID=UPI000371D16C|nr:histidine kinase [Nocardiopsis prasina]